MTMSAIQHVASKTLTTIRSAVHRLWPGHQSQDVVSTVKRRQRGSATELHDGRRRIGRFKDGDLVQVFSHDPNDSDTKLLSTVGYAYDNAPERQVVISQCTLWPGLGFTPSEIERLANAPFATPVPYDELAVIVPLVWKRTARKPRTASREAA
jgi:hypothetical protein